MAKVRMQDVAAHAGVSTRTVSNVVNDYVHVSPAMRERVQRSLDELGYKMDYVARGLKSGRTGFIALAVPTLAGPYFGELAEAVVHAAAGRSLTVLVEVTGGDLETELRIVRGGLTNLADGVLLSALALPLNSDDQPPPDFPLVLLGEHRPGHNLDHVCIDNIAAARTAVQHLIEGGYRRIAIIGADIGETGRLRYEGYRQALAEAGIAPPEALPLQLRDGNRAGGMAVVESMFSARMLVPDAIFAFNDEVAIGAMRALSAHGLRVPDDVAVIGIDNIVEDAYTTPPLSSVAPDLPALAERALDLLDEQSQRQLQPRAPRQEFTSFRLVVRDSSRPPESGTSR
jgi:DNA-binding LacI/PurR family transcriptional regulator